MFVADPPAVVQPSESEPLDVIEVVANRPGQAQKIDRRAYRVKETPQSAQFNGIQLLRGLPSVTITPDDQILLLGAAGVTILVDERPVNGDPILYLRTLHGSDIERIEIMTNPSAQYATGTGGVINFVLRKKTDDGLSGSANAELSSRGNVDAGSTIKKKKGDWTYELQAQGKAGRTSESTFSKLRSIQQFEGGPSTINRETGGGHSSQYFASATGKLTYDISERTSITGELFGGGGRTPSVGRTDFTGLTPDFESFSERTTQKSKVSFIAGSLSLDHKGKKDGETVKARLGVYGNPTVHQPIVSQFSDATDYSSIRDRDGATAHLSADWVHPLGKDQILSLGVSANSGRNEFAYEFSSSDPDRYGPDFDDRFDFQETTASAYGTFQQRFGTWTVMPGLRFEGLWRTISSPGRPSTKMDRANLSPTLHIEHPLSKTVNMTLSYSKRFEAPGPELVHPYPIVLGPLAIEQGNPNLKEQVTDAYEVNLHYSRKSLEAGVIIYDRETSRIWSNVYTVNDEGLNVYMPINIGKRSDRGAQFDISTPLFKRVKGSASINLFSSRVPVLTEDGADYDSAFRYTGNATVEWQGKPRGKTPGDILQAQLTYFSPTREYQFRRDDYASLSLAYTHSLSRTFSLTANLSGIGSARTGHRLRAPLVQEDYERREGPEFKFKIVKTLGGAR